VRLRQKLVTLFSDTQLIAEGEAAGLKIVARGADPNFARGTYELPIQQLLASHLDPGEVFYDIGANLGFFSLIAARRTGPAGQVYAFEPVPQNAAAIERSARLNGFGTIRVFAEAAGATTGHAELLLAHHIGGAALASADTPPDMSGRMNVMVTTIDEAIERRGLRPPSLVKIDVEGAEMDVLLGMTGTLRSHRPTVIYELDDARCEGLERKARTIASFMASKEYGLTVLPASYSNQDWQVAHVLALPVAA
jgi:FkbM family methyltransferase